MYLVSRNSKNILRAFPLLCRAKTVFHFFWEYVLNLHDLTRNTLVHFPSVHILLWTPKGLVFPPHSCPSHLLLHSTMFSMIICWVSFPDVLLPLLFSVYEKCWKLSYSYRLLQLPVSVNFRCKDTVTRRVHLFDADSGNSQTSLFENDTYSLAPCCEPFIICFTGVCVPLPVGKMEVHRKEWHTCVMATMSWWPCPCFAVVHHSFQCHKQLFNICWNWCGYQWIV